MDGDECAHGDKVWGIGPLIHIPPPDKAPFPSDNIHHPPTISSSIIIITIINQHHHHSQDRTPWDISRHYYYIHRPPRCRALFLWVHSHPPRALKIFQGFSSVPAFPLLGNTPPRYQDLPRPSDTLQDRPRFSKPPKTSKPPSQDFPPCGKSLVSLPISLAAALSYLLPLSPPSLLWSWLSA